MLNDLGLFPTCSLPPPLQHSITSQGYVFPVYGPSGYGDTFGAPRSDVPGGWHHGDDIFAPLGAPLLAVADGVVFSVGPNPIGGNRLWLQDRAGNQYYYAHLSAYTPLARNGTHVHAGDVLGFVGNTGDAAGGPYHLHFEVHPASLLFLGYDGAVDPTPYLDAWRHLQDVRFPAGVAWAPQPLHSLLPPAGAILLQSSDISTASGLDPATLRQAIEPHARRRAPLRGAGTLRGGRQSQALSCRRQTDEPFGEALHRVARARRPCALTQRRVARPVNGLKKIPIATPVASSDDVPEAVRLRLLSLLDPVGRLAELADRAAQVGVDLLVARDPRCDRRDAPSASEALVDRPRRGERVAQVLTKLVVRQRALRRRACAVPAAYLTLSCRGCHDYSSFRRLTRVYP